MSVSTRYIIGVSGIVAVSSLVLGVVIIFMGLDDEVRSWERNARSSAALVALAVDDEGLAAVRSVVDGQSTLSAAAVYGPNFAVVDMHSEQGLEEVLPDSAQLAELVAGSGKVRAGQVLSLPDNPGVAVGVREDSAGYVAVAVSQREFVEDVVSLLTAGLLTVLALAGVAALLSAWLVRRLARPLVALARATADLEQGSYDPAVLKRAVRRKDEVGVLVRRFDVMAREVQHREEELQRQVAALQVRIDEVERAKSVERITGSRSFTEIQEKAQRMRQRRRGLERGTSGLPRREEQEA